ncbi:MAG: glycosyltransferase [Candidatus Micrarchaeaceae archaeon]
MDIAIAQSNLTLYGGAERVILKIAQHYHAKIYTAEYNPDTTFPEFKDLDIIVVGSNKLKKILPYGRVMQGLNYGLSFYNLKLEDYDVINAHIAPSHWIRNKNEKVLWYCHTPLRDIYDLYKFRLSLKKWYQKPVYVVGSKIIKKIDQYEVKKIEFIFANSVNVKKRIIKYYGRDDAIVLNGGIEYEKYANKGDDKYFFYPSRISPNKRQDFALKAFEIFKKQIKGYKLILTGAVSNDKIFKEYYDEIKREANKIGDVKIFKNVSEKMQIELYSKATAILYPPLNEDYGLVPLEAMASRKPIIAVNEGGPKETIENGKTGFLINNEKEMAEKMIFIAEHPKIADLIGKKGADRVKEKYSWDKFFIEFDKGLKKTMKS